MCYINLTMWGIPATVVHGDSLRLKEWGRWVNMFWQLGEAERKQQLKSKKIMDAIKNLQFAESDSPAFPRSRN